MTLFDQYKSLSDQPIICGHSAGGAIATLAAYYLRAQSPICYTFCSPRVGDPEFAGEYAKSAPNTFRIFNTEDIVPTLPSATFDFSKHNIFDVLTKNVGYYQHVGVPSPLTFNLCDIVDNHDINQIAQRL